MPLFTQPNHGREVTLLENQQELIQKYALDPETLQPVPGGTVRQVAFSPKTQKWYGWSHRAIYGFGVGDRVKVGDVIATTAEWPFNEGEYRHFKPGFVAKTLDDAKAMAAAFADAVS